MKNKIVAFLVLICCTLVPLISCDTTPDDMYVSYLASYTTDLMFSRIPLEEQFWTSDYFEKSHMKDRTITVMGEQISGEYTHSTITRGSPYASDYYMTKDRRRFVLCEKNNTVTAVEFFSDSEEQEKCYMLPEVENHRENALSIAAEWAAVYLKNPSEYTISVKEEEKQQDINGEMKKSTQYLINYKRFIKGFPTNDCFNICISSTGFVIYMNLGQNFSYEELKLDFDVEKVQTSIENKLKTIFDSIDYKINSYKVDREAIEITPNGKVILLSSLLVDVTKPDSTVYETGIALYTVIGSV